MTFSKIASTACSNALPPQQYRHLNFNDKKLCKNLKTSSNTSFSFKLAQTPHAKYRQMLKNSI